MAETEFVALLANDEQTITLAADYGSVEVVNLGTAPVYVRADGDAAVIQGAGCEVVLPNGTLELQVDTDGASDVSLITATAGTVGLHGGPQGRRAGAGLSTTAVAGVVEVANDAGNPLPVNGTVTITDGSGPVTVDGTVTITDGSGPLTVDAAALDIALSALRDAIAGAGAGAKTLANLATLLSGGLPAALGVNGGLKIDPAALSLQVRQELFNSTFADAVSNTQQTMGASGVVAPIYTAILENIFNGTGWDRRRTAFVFKPLNAVGIAAETTLWTPNSGKKFRLMGALLSAGVAAGNILLKDNTGGTTIFEIPKVPVDTPVMLDLLGNGILSGAANRVLTATGVATQTLSGTLFGTEE
jgi:hypothetical protein